MVAGISALEGGIMTQSVPILYHRWYRVALWCVAVSSLMGCLYFFSTNRGWLPGVTGPTHSLLLMGSSTAIIWSVLALGRNDRLAVGFSLLGVLLLIGGLVSFVQSY